MAAKKKSALPCVLEVGDRRYEITEDNAVQLVQELVIEVAKFRDGLHAAVTKANEETKRVRDQLNAARVDLQRAEDRHVSVLDRYRRSGASSGELERRSNWLLRQMVKIVSGRADDEDEYEQLSDLDRYEALRREIASDGPFNDDEEED